MEMDLATDGLSSISPRAAADGPIEAPRLECQRASGGSGTTIPTPRKDTGQGGPRSYPESEEATDADRPGSYSTTLGPHTFAALTLPHSYPHIQARRPRHRGAKKLAQARLANTLTEPRFDPPLPPTKASVLMPLGHRESRKVTERERDLVALHGVVWRMRLEGEVWSQSLHVCDGQQPWDSRVWALLGDWQ